MVTCTLVGMPLLSEASLILTFQIIRNTIHLKLLPRIQNPIIDIDRIRLPL